MRGGGIPNMDVSIKSFDVEMDVKNKGIELEISEPTMERGLEI